MDHNIVFHIVNMITFLSLSGGFIYLMVKVNYISRLLTDKLLNDTNHKLLEMMYKRMRSVGILTNAEKALHAYMKKKVSIIYTGYKEAKKNPNVINNPTFFNSIIQEGLTFITSSYNYPTEFIETLEKINKTCFEQFKNDYSFDAATLYN